MFFSSKKLENGEFKSSISIPEFQKETAFSPGISVFDNLLWPASQASVRKDLKRCDSWPLTNVGVAQRHEFVVSSLKNSSFNNVRMDRNAERNRIFLPQEVDPIEVLGRGYYGCCRLLRVKESGELMVMKQMSKSRDLDVLRSLAFEFSLLRTLSHPNVLRVTGILVTFIGDTDFNFNQNDSLDDSSSHQPWQDERFFMLTEYMVRGTLERVLFSRSSPGGIMMGSPIRTSDILPLWLRTKMARDIACGMEYLHGLQIIHRDLNSSNCFVRCDWTVVVGDFGLARILENDGSVVGRPFYMAPEMLNHQIYDYSVDIFSFGIVLCEIITCQSTDPEIIRHSDFTFDCEKFRLQIAGSQFTECRRFYPIIVRCCHFIPHNRPKFHTIEAWLSALSLILRYSK